MDPKKKQRTPLTTQRVDTNTKRRALRDCGVTLDIFKAIRPFDRISQMTSTVDD